MRASFREQSAHENELERKRSELSTLRSRHVSARKVLAQLQDEIADFKLYGQQTLGWRLKELDCIEQEISRLARANDVKNDRHRAPDTESGLPEGRSDSDFTACDIKSLYRKVAKAVHPDLARLEAAKLDRHELMARANRAYAEEDLRTLRDMLGTLRAAGDREAAGDGAELAALDRLLDRERCGLEAVETEVAVLRRSCAWRCKLRLDSGGVTADLLADMVAIADVSIAEARRRLALLKGARQGRRRNLHFPGDASWGTVYIRERSCQSYLNWREVGEARGWLDVGAGESVRLDIRGGAGSNLGRLRELPPEALQALFLYDAEDRDLVSLRHLTGLEELYLSGAGLTDAALFSISSCSNLRRLYIYQTAITDLGLAYLNALPHLSSLISSGNSIT